MIQKDLEKVEQVVFENDCHLQDIESVKCTIETVRVSSIIHPGYTSLSNVFQQTRYDLAAPLFLFSADFIQDANISGVDTSCINGCIKSSFTVALFETYIESTLFIVHLSPVLNAKRT